MESKELNKKEDCKCKKNKVSVEKVLMIIAFIGYSLWLILDTIRVLLYNREEIPGNLQFWAVYFVWELLCEGSLVVLTFVLAKNRKAKVILTIVPALLITAYMAFHLVQLIQAACMGELELNIINETYMLATLLALISVSITSVKLIKERKAEKNEGAE